jgi:hypothetical protein
VDGLTLRSRKASSWIGNVRSNDLERLKSRVRRAVFALFRQIRPETDALAKPSFAIRKIASFQDDTGQNRQNFV